MSSVIQNMIAKTIGDGARSSKFDCILSIRDLSNDTIPDSDLVYHVKTSQFPGKSVDIIDFKYKGRTIPIKGQVKYDNTWSCTFYLTSDHKLKSKIENWIEALEQVHNMHSNLSKDVRNLQKDFSNKDLSYTSEMQIIQYDFDGITEKAIYTLYNVFPKSVSSIDVNYSEVGSILEYTVEFSYSHYTFKYGEVSDSKTKAEALEQNLNTTVTEAVDSIKDSLSEATSKFSFSEGGFEKSVTNAINNVLSDGI